MIRTLRSGGKHAARRELVLPLCVVLVGLGCAVAEGIDTPANSFALADTTIRELQASALSGVGTSAYSLALYYTNVGCDERNYLKWLGVAASNGVVRALYDLGVYWQSHQGDGRSHSLSAAYLSCAVSLGYWEANGALAQIYEDMESSGNSVPASTVCWEMCAWHGNVFAMQRLASLLQGRGEATQAMAWLMVVEQRLPVGGDQRREVAGRIATLGEDLGPRDLAEVRIIRDLIEQRVRQTECESPGRTP